MDRVIRSYLETSEFAANPDQLRDAVGAVIALIDLHSFAYMALPNNLRPRPYLVSNYALPWTTHYQNQAYHLRDPVIRHSLRVFELFTWGAEFADRFGRGARDIFHEARMFDICCGVTVPIRNGPGSPAAITFVTDRRRLQYLTCLRSNAFALHFIAVHFHKHLHRIVQPDLLIGDALLTPREEEILKWASHGKSRTDIAQIMDINKRIVVRDLERAKAKLGVRSTCQAVRVYTAYKANRGTNSD